MDAISLLALAKASKGGGGGSTPATHVYTLSATFQQDINTAVQTCITTILMNSVDDAVDASLTPSTADKLAIGLGAQGFVNDGIIPCFYALNVNFVPSVITVLGTAYEIQISIPIYNTTINGTSYFFNIHVYLSNSIAMVHVHKAGQV